MIISKLISGLGNQLFQYAMGRQLSLIKNVPLKLDTSFFESQNLRSYKLHHYNIRAGIADKKEVDRLLHVYKSMSVFARSYRKAEKLLLPKQKRSYFRENEWWVYEPELLAAGSNVYLDGYWQHYRYFQNLHPEIFKELTVKENYTAPVKKIIAEISADMSSVSIHIRRGDYLTDSQAYNFMGIMPPEYYDQAMAYIRQKVTNPSYYIFSDDLNWVKDHLKIEGAATFMDIEGGSKDYIELDMMSKCSHNIIANSSFSWWGAFLNQNPDKIVVAPKQWVRPDDINKKIQLQFPSWIKI
jgi:hypothetical protein